MKYLYFFIAAANIAVFCSCEISESSLDNEISGTGTIKIIQNEFLLNTDTNLQYVIMNLQDEFKVDNLKVKFRGIIHENPNQYGIDKIELTHISKI